MDAATQLMTADELINLPRGRYRYELVKGELLTMSPSGAKLGAVVMNLSAPLFNYVKAKKLGVVFGAETGFKLASNPDTVLAPDISFLRRERGVSIIDGYLEIAPDLAVAVISPSEMKRKVNLKAARWIDFGTSVVWLVFTRTKEVEVRRRTGKSTTLKAHDQLIGDEVVPGFRIQLSEIFDLG